METDNNPYQTPEGDLTANSDDGYGEVRFFSPGIRIGRMRYLSHSFLFTMFSYIALLPGMFLLGSGTEIVGMILLAIGYIALFGLIFIAAIQRLHDLDKSGWMSLLLIVPLANVFVAIYMLCGRGTEGSNNYGKPPPPNKTWNIVCGWFFILLPLIGILAAIALPAYQEYVTRAQGL